MSNHTPGPWHLTDGSDSLYIQAGCAREAAYVAEIRKTPEAPHLMADDEANAHLIAAAPELLDAADAVVKQWDTPNWKLTEHTGVFIAALRAAINKAKGVQ